MLVPQQCRMHLESQETLPRPSASTCQAVIALVPGARCGQTEGQYQKGQVKKECIQCSKQQLYSKSSFFPTARAPTNATFAQADQVASGCSVPLALAGVVVVVVTHLATHYQDLYPSS